MTALEALDNLGSGGVDAILEMDHREVGALIGVHRLGDKVHFSITYVLHLDLVSMFHC